MSPEYFWNQGNIFSKWRIVLLFMLLPRKSVSRDEKTLQLHQLVVCPPQGQLTANTQYINIYFPGWRYGRTAISQTQERIKLTRFDQVQASVSGSRMQPPWSYEQLTREDLQKIPYSLLRKRRRQHRIKLCCLVELPIKDQEEELIYSHLYKPRFTNMQRRWLKMMGPHRIRCCALWARVANECFFREPTATQSSASESSRRSPTKRWGGAVCWTDLRATRPEFPLPPRGTGK